MEELKPCPFCGKAQSLEIWKGGEEIVDPPCIGEYFTKEEWQNAYCWEEIDRLTLQLKEAVIQRGHLLRNKESLEVLGKKRKP